MDDITAYTAADETLVQETAELTVALMTREGALTPEQVSQLVDMEWHGGSHSQLGAYMRIHEWEKALQAALPGDDGSVAKDAVLREVKRHLLYIITDWNYLDTREAMRQFVTAHGHQAQ
ncbi:hypothetical protein ABZ419_03605 [Streptomyces cinnamoneus]|uniref:hypothetical protein n=1 Tax=Streptomyces cinnamoneus TaxID=53446 RepID=UPI0033E92312